MASPSFDLISEVKNILFKTGQTASQNLQSWGRVISQPQLRQDYRQQVIQPKVQQFTNYIKPILQQQYSPQNIVRSITQPISVLPQIGRQMMKIPQAPSLVGPTIKAGPTRVPVLGPIQQLPSFITQNIASYGRTLAEPQKHKLETALNVLPFLPIGRLKAISPKNFSTSWLNEGTKEVVKPETIGGLERQINRLIGHTSGGMNWKMEYHVRNKLLNYAKQEAPLEVRKQIGRLEGLIDNIRNAREAKTTAKELATGLSQLKEAARIRQAQDEVQELLKVPKVKNWIKSLDKTAFKVIQDWENKAQAVLAQPTIKTTEKIAQRGAVDLGRVAKQSYREWESALLRQEGVRNTREATETIAKGIKEKTISPLSNDVENLKDISGFTAGMRDIYRNFKAVFGQKFEVAKRLILDPFDESKGKFIDELNQWTGALENYIGKKLGIKKGSLESMAVQQFGEKTITEADLLRKFGVQKTKNITEADNWFRQSYDQLLNEVNAIRAKIYPNDPTKIISRRQDYYRHFREMAQGFRGLVNIFDVPANVASPLSGISEFTKPKATWLSIAQRRLGLGTDVDAVGGFLDYIKASSYAKHIDPNIPKFRILADELAQATGEGTPYRGKLNNFIEFLNDFSNDLAGKTNPLDRTMQKWIPGGRKTFRIINWMNSRVKANVMLGNASASLAQVFNVPQGMANVQNPKYWIKGIGETLASMFVRNRPMENSIFIKERYFNAFDKFNRSLLYQPYRFTKWMITALDEVGTKYIWNMHYDKALDMGVSNAIKYADDITRSMVAGRGIGEVPLAQKSRLFQMVAPFQIEVTNLWWVMKDFVDERAFGKIATLFVFNHLFNNVAERIRGSRVTLDPIQATLEAINTFQQEESKGKGTLMAGGRLLGEALSNIPVGQTFGAIYPEYGFKVGETQYPTRKQFFGREDPTRFGGGALFTRGITDPLYKLLPPFGGQQIKRTIGGLGAYDKGYAESAKGLVQYPIGQNLRNLLQAGTLGKTALPEAQEYFKKERKPLGEKQSEFFKQAQDRLQAYKEIINKREVSAQEDKVKQIVSGTGVSTYYGNKYFYLEDGEVKTIDTSFKPTQPVLTGQTELDKKLISKYRSEITKRENIVISLFEQGQKSQEEAEKELLELKQLRTKINKPKVRKIKRVSFTKLPFKKATIKGLKLSRAKLPAIKLKKAPTFKITKVKLPKIEVPKSQFKGFKITKPVIRGLGGIV